MPDSKQDEASEKRRDEVLRRMLNTPPKPHKKPQTERGPRPSAKKKG